MTDLGDSALISWEGVDWQPVLQGISPHLHICIDANEGRDLHLSNEASQTQPDPEEFLAPAAAPTSGKRPRGAGGAIAPN